MKLWGGRFYKETDSLANDYNSSIKFDQRLYKEDIKGSIAHVKMLGNQDIIPKENAVKFMESLKMIAIVTHVADARSCILHPASTTHRQLSDKALQDCGIEPNLLRLSVGIENAEDIIADIANALSQI